MSPTEIKALRERLGLTQTEFAARLQVGQDAVSRWESGERNPSGPARVLLEQMAQQAAPVR